jgi:hypothetical protein
MSPQQPWLPYILVRVRSQLLNTFGCALVGLGYETRNRRNGMCFHVPNCNCSLPHTNQHMSNSSTFKLQTPKVPKITFPETKLRNYTTWNHWGHENSFALLWNNSKYVQRNTNNRFSRWTPELMSMLSPWIYETKQTVGLVHPLAVSSCSTVLPFFNCCTHIHHAHCQRHWTGTKRRVNGSDLGATGAALLHGFNIILPAMLSSAVTPIYVLLILCVLHAAPISLSLIWAL